MPPEKPMTFWFRLVSLSARTISWSRAVTAAPVPIRAVLVDFATSTPSDDPIPPPAPPATFPAVCTMRISASVSTVTSSPATTVLLSPISASTVSLTTDTPTIPPVPLPPTAILTMVCKMVSSVLALTETSRVAFADPSMRARTVLAKTCVSISRLTAPAPALMPLEILFSSVFDEASRRTS